VRGHAGHPQNEYANFLATRAAAEQTRSDGLVPSGFEAWVTAQRAKGAVKGGLEPFPDAATFRPATLPRLRVGATTRP
jgi:ribonuclease HI